MSDSEFYMALGAAGVDEWAATAAIGGAARPGNRWYLSPMSPRWRAHWR